jgi:hypothetical protein
VAPRTDTRKIVEMGMRAQNMITIVGSRINIIGVEPV